ncbi:hypothetical protein [Glaciecola petra]|uniref:Uncharacterized protein n=1 Tax=Glaciecola petra TaxID=3075602 RepID=A0ABU2ZNA2_9ALTE|nr:hypothetical protein [Aestuariibacter sp. P117]MDT0594107.1 hypothetical protein [Aestuariibacter sp. P117]
MKSIFIIAGIVLSASSFASPPIEQSNIFNDIKNDSVLAQKLNKQDLIEIIGQHNDESNQLALPQIELLPIVDLIPSQTGSNSRIAKVIKLKQVAVSE